MHIRIIALAVAFSLLTAIVVQVPLQTCTHVCVNPVAVITVMTTPAVATTAHNHTPNNHNLQEMALTIEKTHDFANSADYMDGLTASSKRSVYVGDAERRVCARINI